MTIRLNDEQGLYVIPSGKGYSCLGYDVCEKRIEGYAAWLQSHNQPLPAMTASRGTLARYQEYIALCAAASAFNRSSGKRCPIHLTPELMGLERERVEITQPDGEKRRFYVGKSTGWAPCHLEIKTKRSIGGCAAYFPKGSTVRVIS